MDEIFFFIMLGGHELKLFEKKWFRVGVKRANSENWTTFFETNFYFIKTIFRLKTGTISD